MGTVLDTQVRQTPTRTPFSTNSFKWNLQKKCADRDCSSEKMLHHSDPAELSTAPRIVHEVLQSQGDPIDPGTRAYMEQRFGHDFGKVRVHSDVRGAESARAVNALAYTVDKHIIFQSGQYKPGSIEGKRMLAHELVHVLQQRQTLQTNANDGGIRKMGRADIKINAKCDSSEEEAKQIAETIMGTDGEGRTPVINALVGADPIIQRIDEPDAPQCPTLINFSTDDPVHAPSCGQFRAQTDVAGITWSLAPDPTAVNPGTSIAANGIISISDAQAAGQIKAVATVNTDSSSCLFERSFRIRSHPTGIANTVMLSMASDPVNNYGAVFDHTFISSDGNVASLENVAVGERFTGVPNPTGATHAINAPMNPFGGTFTLETATLTPNATDNWFLTADGRLGGTNDDVEMSRNINVGRFVQSASNPSPTQSLPATMTLNQGLHWYCPQAAAANRWRMPAFVNVAHSRTLRNRGSNVEFVTTVNGLEVVETYSGPLAVFNLTASPASTPRNPAPAPTPSGGTATTPVARTVRITVDSLPTALRAGQSINFSFVGNDLGCRVAADPQDDHAAILTVGENAGAVTIEASDPSGVNRARVRIVIT